MTRLEELLSRAGLDGAILDLGLSRELLGRLDWRDHALDGEKRSQVRRIRADQDEREEPPHSGD